MVELYTVVVIIASCALAAVTSFRVGYLMGDRWFRTVDAQVFFGLLTAAIAAVAVGIICKAATIYGGIPAGLLIVLASIPLVGIVWIFILGTNKALERILNSLLNKVG